MNGVDKGDNNFFSVSAVFLGCILLIVLMSIEWRETVRFK